MKRSPLVSVFFASLVLLSVTGCSSLLTNAAKTSDSPSVSSPDPAPNFNEETLPTVSKEEFVEALTVAYTDFLSKQGGQAIILTGTPLDTSYGEGVTINGVVNPDGTYSSTTSLTKNGETTMLSSVCVDASTCFISADNGISWFAGVGSGNDWSPKNRAETALLLVNPDGETADVIYRMDADKGQYSIMADSGVPQQNLIFEADNVTDYKTLLTPGEKAPSTTVTTTSFGSPVPVETPENILDSLGGTP